MPDTLTLDIPTFDESRQQFLAALNVRLNDPNVSAADKEDDCRGIISAVSQMMVLADARRG